MKEDNLVEIAQTFMHRDVAIPYLIDGELELHLAVLSGRISDTAAKKSLEVKLGKTVAYPARFKIALQEAYKEKRINIELL